MVDEGLEGFALEYEVLLKDAELEVPYVILVKFAPPQVSQYYPCGSRHGSCTVYKPS